MKIKINRRKAEHILLQHEKNCQKSAHQRNIDFAVDHVFF